MLRLLIARPWNSANTAGNASGMAPRGGSPLLFTNTGKKSMHPLRVPSAPFFTRRSFGAEKSNVQHSVPKEAPLPSTGDTTTPVDNLQRRRHARKAEVARKLNPEEPKCVAYSSCASFRMQGLKEHVVRKYREVQHAEGKDIEVLHFEYGKDKRVFILQEYGVVVWGLTPSERTHLFNEIEPFQLETETEPESEEFNYTLRNQSGISGDQLLLNENPEKMITDMLVISHSMARSVKLGILEGKTDNAMETVKSLPNTLRLSGKLDLGPKQINRHIGEILYIRGLLNLHTDLNETPDICWDDSRLEHLFSSVSRQLDIHPRIRRVNDKLNFGKELMDEMKHQSNQKHGTFLEWIIILLIAIEVFFGIEERGFYMDYYFPYRMELPEHTAHAKEQQHRD